MPVPFINSKNFEPAPTWMCTDKELVRNVKATTFRGMLGHWPSEKRYGSITAMQLIAARLPPRLMALHVHWKEGDTYEDICRKRLNLLNGLYPEW